jgi:PH (Pleckstrin Homology) domain-containing protein
MSSDPNASATEPSVPLRLSFVTTAQASADAHALARPRLNAFDRSADIVASLVGLFTIVVGVAWSSVAMCAVGVVLLVVATLSIIGTRSHPFQRWVISRRFGSMLGQRTDVTVDERGLGLSNSLATMLIPWSAITTVRSTPRTVAFFRGPHLVGYIPASAFASPRAQAATASFSALRIETAAGNST